MLARLDRFLDIRLGALPRALVLASVLALAPSFLAPLWRLTLFAPQYPEGLRLDIYSYQLRSGNQGNDIREINILNHYIGMRPLEEASFNELRWMPFAIGVLALLLLRAAALGRMIALVDVLVLFVYFSTFSVGSFGYRLYAYGHELDPTAPVKVPPFTPPMFGSAQLANFEVYSYPGPATYGMLAVPLLLGAALWLAARRPAGTGDP